MESGTVAKSHQGSVADLLDRWLEDIEPTRTAMTALGAVTGYAHALEGRDRELACEGARQVLQV